MRKLFEIIIIDRRNVFDATLTKNVRNILFCVNTLVCDERFNYIKSILLCVNARNKGFSVLFEKFMWI